MFVILYVKHLIDFPTNILSILDKIDCIDPIDYGKTRNYLNGSVTRLSPYISRGVISTRQVAEKILAKGYKPYEIESFLKELAWRDYFQQVWIHLGDKINTDIKNKQDCNHHRIPENIIHHRLGVDAIDNSIQELYQTGYMHNHARMYVASITCNLAKSHWQMPAKWMYYHLLDADWASNALSWQWVAGSFSSKKYFANQENINRFCDTNQTGTFLDMSYEDLELVDMSSELGVLTDFSVHTNLPSQREINLNDQLPTYIYNFYNLDCGWKNEVNANRVLLLEPSFFNKYPVCDRTIEFVINLSKNIEGIQIFIGEFDELLPHINPAEVNFKEHPTNKHYKGIEHAREWMFGNSFGYVPSFFKYWQLSQKGVRNF